MSRIIKENELENIVAEAAALALEKLSVLSESKGQNTSEKNIDEAVKESIKMVLEKPTVK